MAAATDAAVRTAIYDAFSSSAGAPDASSVAIALGTDLPGVKESMRRLADAHEIVLLPGTDQVWMAHPFSGVPTGYVVTANDGRRFWANCAWDALAIPSLVGDVTVEVKSPVDGERWTYTVENGAISTHHLVHFLVPAAHFWDDIGFT